VNQAMKRGTAALLTALMCLSLCGCSFKFATSPDELYSLPRLPEQYTELEDSINKILGDGAEYAAPVSGSNIQPVQLVDLDGDGQEEALAFFRKSTDDKPLKIYIFTADGQTYRQSAVIEGSGTAIYSISYSDLNKDGKQELIVGWKVGTDLQALSVYSLRGSEPKELMRTAYVKYAVTDLDKNELQEITVLHTDGEGSSVADYYTWQRDGTLALSSTARLSMTMAELTRVRTGTLAGSVPALYAVGVSETGEAITDILTLRQHNDLTNVVLSDVTGVSTAVFRDMSLYPMDINGDGITEVPAPSTLPTRGDNCYQINWLAYDASGAHQVAETTYHDIDDGWYLVLPDAWQGKIMVTRSQSGMNEMAVTFSLRSTPGTKPEDFLRIYAITGNNRESKAVSGNRFILSRQSETIFAGELLARDQTWEHGITEDQLRSSFNLITTEWTAGDN